MSLRYALLALLRVGPQSGYDLQKQFSLSVGHVWHAPDSQIYPELRKMESEGLIEGEDQLRGERGTRRLYHMTSAGDEALLSWMESPLDYQRVRDPAHLRASYLEMRHTGRRASLPARTHRAVGRRARTVGERATPDRRAHQPHADAPPGGHSPRAAGSHRGIQALRLRRPGRPRPRARSSGPAAASTSSTPSSLSTSRRVSTRTP